MVSNVRCTGGSSSVTDMYGKTVWLSIHGPYDDAGKPVWKLEGSDIPPCLLAVRTDRNGRAYFPSRFTLLREWIAEKLEDLADRIRGERP